MSHLAVILARGGSKRLPRKNIIDFHGKPMLAWTVEAALASGRFDRILVSTDDAEIATIATSAGAEVPFLRLQACDDIAPSSAATLEALRQAEEHWSTEFEFVTQLMPNCPLRTATDIDLFMAAFHNRVTPSQISCTRFGWQNPWWSARVNEAGQPDYLFEEARVARSQDLPPLYCPSGAIWTAERHALRAAGTFYMTGHTLFPLPWMSAVDIDDATDLQIAESLFPVRRHAEAQCPE